jgi:hypothetical protein
VLQSVAAGHWLDEEAFELASLFPAVKVLAINVTLPAIEMRAVHYLI